MSDCDAVLMHNGRMLRCKQCSRERFTHRWHGESGSEFIEWSDPMQGAFRLSDVPDVKDLFPDGPTRSVTGFLGSEYVSGIRRDAGTYIWEIYYNNTAVRMGRELSEEEAILQMHIAARHMVIRDMKRGER